ncbi:type IV secretory system conjugative DNA transfer family protein [Bythopirellula goksoeyrii]|uniref:Coupling protein TraD n=1 Tax=Bythopirellula goksoeyrii TaxID=1400387 RepID=A0A5B9QE87_9BACT|nr:type IV secretion system DNA-binding domain-containing protein [Bythopirellula goksoeyrii]QEG35905.1 Coupling protein TraD [Bythopirellula goksoeyrii]
MDISSSLRLLVVVGLVLGLVFRQQVLRWLRVRSYTRGRQLAKPNRSRMSGKSSHGLRWGNNLLPESTATQHFLAAGVTGSGKSHVQRLLMKSVLENMHVGSDSRVLIYDAKGETTAYLKKVGVTTAVYSLNPFESRKGFPQAVAWDIARDITSPTRALNFSCSLIKAESSGANQYFTNSARLIVNGVLLSFIKHSAGVWTFSDLVHATLSRDRLEAVLSRDTVGRELFARFLPDDRTGHSVLTSVISSMGYYAPVAALWQRTPEKLSIRDWLSDSSVLLLGVNKSASATLDVLNEQIFRFLVEEIDGQRNSSTRRTWVWVDEAREAKSILRSEGLQALAVKGRSRGACLLLAFQDIEGFREAAGSDKIADEIIGQCSHKAILRMESPGSAEWAAKMLGQYETLEIFRSESSGGRGFFSTGHNVSEQRVMKDSVLPSEFFTIPPTNKQNGLTGYFLSPDCGARKITLPSSDISPIVVSEQEEERYALVSKPESDQWLREWSMSDRQRLSLPAQPELELADLTPVQRGQKLKFRPGPSRQAISKSKMPAVTAAGRGD